MKINTFKILLLVSLVAGCSTSSKVGREEEAVSQKAPEPTPGGAADVAATVKLTKSIANHSVQEVVLGNGLNVLYLDDSSLPYVSLALMVKAGSSYDPDGLEGLTKFVAELVDKGTKKKKATEVAEAFAGIGSDFNASVANDYTIFSAGSLSADSQRLVDEFADIIIQPTMTDDEVTRVRQQLLAEIVARRDQPEVIADQSFMQLLYGKHPYSKSTIGQKSTIEAIKKKNIIQHYLKYFRPNNSYLAVVGKVDDALRAKIQARFSEWIRQDVTPVNVNQAVKNEGPKIRLITKGDSQQAQIRLGHLGIQRNHPEFVTLRVANTALGGAFNSRLVNRVRRDLGLTYDIASEFDADLGVGPFLISTFTKSETVGKVIREVEAVVREYCDKGISLEELEATKGYLKGMFPRAIETSEKLAQNLLLLRLYGVSDNYLRDYLANVDELTVREVNKAIRQYIKPEQFRISVFGNPSVETQLKEIGTLDVKSSKDVL